MKSLRHLMTGAIALIFLIIGCDAVEPDLAVSPAGQPYESSAPRGDSYTGFGAMVFDITATPNGSILFATVDFAAPPQFFGANTVREIGRRGVIEVTSIPTGTNSPVNGLEPIGNRNFFAASGGDDRTAGAGLWRVSRGSARLVADIGAFTLGTFDFTTGGGEPGPYPDAWKDQRCEPLQGPFSPGPQTNPYHLTALNGGEVLVADAANNGVLLVRTNGEIEVVAFMDPPKYPGEDWMVLGTFDLSEFDHTENPFADYPLGDDVITCYVEPVPTAVAIGPDGAYYVSELTGTTPQNLAGQPSPEGLARIWRIEPGTRDARCPSAECTVAFDGLNAVTDIEFGPDGKLYVVEFDRAGGAAGFQFTAPLGGSLQSCELASGSCEVVESAFFPGAITFDKWGNLWLVENVFAPTIRKVELN